MNSKVSLLTNSDARSNLESRDFRRMTRDQTLTFIQFVHVVARFCEKICRTPPYQRVWWLLKGVNLKKQPINSILVHIL